jgi:hypothetical protein
MNGLAHLLRPTFSYVITSGTTSTVGARTTPIGVVALRINATADVWVSIGPNPTATATGSMLIQGGDPAEIIKANTGDQVAVLLVATTGTGTVSVTEMSR